MLDSGFWDTDAEDMSLSDFPNPSVAPESRQCLRNSLVERFRRHLHGMLVPVVVFAAYGAAFQRHTVYFRCLFAPWQGLLISWPCNTQLPFLHPAPKT